MDELLKKLGISGDLSPEELLSELEKKQMEYLDRLDSVTDDDRRSELSSELKEIEGAIGSLEWMVKRAANGMARDEEDTGAISVDEEDAKEAAAEEESQGQEGAEAKNPNANNDEKKAEELFEEGCKYLYGNGVLMDYSRAAELFQQGANLGNGGCYVNLGYMYINGYGVPEDTRKANQCYKEGALRGDEVGAANLLLNKAFNELENVDVSTIVRGVMTKDSGFSNKFASYKDESSSISDEVIVKMADYLADYSEYFKDDTKKWIVVHLYKSAYNNGSKEAAYGLGKYYLYEVKTTIDEDSQAWKYLEEAQAARIPGSTECLHLMRSIGRDGELWRYLIKHRDADGVNWDYRYKQHNDRERLKMYQMRLADRQRQSAEESGTFKDPNQPISAGTASDSSASTGKKRGLLGRLFG